MRKVNLNQSLTIRLSDVQRKFIEDLADRREIALGEAARVILDIGQKAMAVT